MKKYSTPAYVDNESGVTEFGSVDVYLASEVDGLLQMKQERIAELERALRTAHQYMMPSVNRGPAYASWCMAIEMVEPLIGESEGRSLIAQCGL